jgi:hypothetical protein
LLRDVALLHFVPQSEEEKRRKKKKKGKGICCCCQESSRWRLGFLTAAAAPQPTKNKD